MFQVFLSAAETFVADVFVNGFRKDTVFQLVGNECVAQIIYFDIFEPGFSEVAIDGGADISDKQGAAGLGHKKVVVFDLGAQTHVVLDSG